MGAIYYRLITRRLPNHYTGRAWVIADVPKKWLPKTIAYFEKKGVDPHKYDEEAENED